MARPLKNNAEYFTHDADMRNDLRIKALRRKFSHTGYAIWCFMLEILTDKDFFQLEWNEITIELLSADFDTSFEELNSVIDYCIRLDLLQLKDGFLSCKTLKKRFNSLIRKREYNKTGVSVTETTNKKVSVTETPKNDSFCNNNPHSKVEESRVKESRVNISTEVDIKKENTSNEVSKNDDKIDYIKLRDFFNNTFKNKLPAIKSIDEARKKAIRARVAAHGKESIQIVFAKTLASAFLLGSNHNNWKCNFDWIFKPTNFQKILEGNYDGNNTATTRRDSANSLTELAEGILQGVMSTTH